MKRIIWLRWSLRYELEGHYSDCTDTSPRAARERLEMARSCGQLHAVLWMSRTRLGLTGPPQKNSVR